MRLISIPSSGILKFTVVGFSGTKSQAFKVRFGGKDVPKRETIAPNRGSLNGKPVGAFVRVEVIYDLRLVLGLPVHVRENLYGSHFGSVPLEAKDRNDRHDNYEKYWNEVSH